jgi:hypothetical protein
MESTPQAKLYYHIELFVEEDYIDYSERVSKDSEPLNGNTHVFEIPQDSIMKFLKRWVVEVNTHDDDDFIIATTNFEALQHRLAYTVKPINQSGYPKYFSSLERTLKNAFNDFCYELFEGEILRLTNRIPQQAPS